MACRQISASLLHTEQLAETYGVEIAREFEVELARHYDPYIKRIFDAVNLRCPSDIGGKQAANLVFVMTVLRRFELAPYGIIPLFRAIDACILRSTKSDAGRGVRLTQLYLNNRSADDILDVDIEKTLLEVKAKDFLELNIKQEDRIRRGVELTKIHLENGEQKDCGVCLAHILNPPSLKSGTGFDRFGEYDKNEKSPEKQWSIDLWDQMVEFDKFHNTSAAAGHGIVSPEFYRAVEGLIDAYYEADYRRKTLLPTDLCVQAVKLKCGHIFGHRCIAEWLYKNRTCPLCRSKIDETPQEALLRRLNGGTRIRLWDGQIFTLWDMPLNAHFGNFMKEYLAQTQRHRLVNFRTDDGLSFMYLAELLRLEILDELSFVDEPFEDEDGDEDVVETEIEGQETEDNGMEDDSGQSTGHLSPDSPGGVRIKKRKRELQAQTQADSARKTDLRVSTPFSISQAASGAAVPIQDFPMRAFPGLIWLLYSIDYIDRGGRVDPSKFSKFEDMLAEAVQEGYVSFVFRTRPEPEK